MRRRRFLDLSARTLFLMGAGASALDARRASGANGRVALALIGCGGRGRLMAQNMVSESLPVDITHIFDADTDHADAAVKAIVDLGGRAPVSARSIDEILAAPVDAVMIATPDHWHAPLTLLALQAGKDAYVEKPHSHNIAEGRAMVEAARRLGRVVQIGAQNRSAPYIDLACDYIRAGNLGSIHLVKIFNVKSNTSFAPRGEPFTLGESKPQPETLDWDLWLGPAPARPFHHRIYQSNGWIAYWDFSCGDMDDGIHQIDIARKLMGDPPAPRQVQATGGRLCFADDDAETPDTLAATWEFDDFLMNYEMAGWPLYMEKSSATIRRNDLLPYWTQNAERIELYGTEQMMILGRMGGGWVAMGSGGRVVHTEYGRVPDTPHQLDFLDSIKSRKPARGAVEVVNPSQELVHLANIAHRVGNTTLRWDGAAGRFIGNEAANALLARKYRAPYEKLL